MYILITETGEYSGGFKSLMFSSLTGIFGYSFYFPTGAPSNLEDDQEDSNSEQDTFKSTRIQDICSRSHWFLKYGEA